MLSVVVPTYNERQALEEFLRRLAAIRPRVPDGMEALIVDDQSADGTPEIAEQFLSRHAMGRVIRRAGRRDLAQAVVAGIHSANGELIGVMDADLSHPPELLPTLVEAIKTGNEVAIASRYVPGGGITSWPWTRRVLSRIGNLMARPLVPITDATSGFFVSDAKLLKGLALHPRGFKILLEILVRGCTHQVQEVPYVFVDRAHGASKLGSRVLWLYLLQLGSLYVHRLNHPCPHASRVVV